MPIPFSQLITFARRIEFDEAIRERRWRPDEVPFSDTTGFHVYSDLDLRLVVAAAEDENTAYINLQILQAYAAAADAIAQSTGLRILEVQGARLHLFRESNQPKKDAEQVVNACKIFHGLATSKIQEIRQTLPFMIRMAGDYGRAILLRSVGEDISESIVSLGNAANRPAKKLARDVTRSGVPAGHLAFNEAALNSDPSAAPVWTLIDLTEVVSIKRDVIESLEEAAKVRYAEVAFSAMQRLAQQFEPNPNNPVQTPQKRGGFMFRADLDQFSPRVATAMSNGDAALRELVREFHTIMNYPAAFKDTLPEGVSVLMFPWAGDCANLFLECNDYSLERTYLPNRAAINWHDQSRGLGGNGTNWRKLLGECKWLVAIAGGDNIDSQHGFILTGNVFADGRTFHIGAGWPWKRSLDAEQSSDTNPEDTVIHNEDHAALDQPLQIPYSEHPAHPSLFKIAPFNRLIKAQTSHDRGSEISMPAVVPGTKVKVSAPRPYVSSGPI
jgi:hypothetical protein